MYFFRDLLKCFVKKKRSGLVFKDGPTVFSGGFPIKRPTFGGQARDQEAVVQ